MVHFVIFKVRFWLGLLYGNKCALSRLDKLKSWSLWNLPIHQFNQTQTPNLPNRTEMSLNNSDKTSRSSQALTRPRKNFWLFAINLEILIYYHSAYTSKTATNSPPWFDPWTRLCLRTARNVNPLLQRSRKQRQKGLQSKRKERGYKLRKRSWAL